jgi:hypothetical protein
VLQKKQLQKQQNNRVWVRLVVFHPATTKSRKDGARSFVVDLLPESWGSLCENIV